MCCESFLVPEFHEVLIDISIASSLSELLSCSEFFWQICIYTSALYDPTNSVLRYLEENKVGSDSHISILCSLSPGLSFQTPLYHRCSNARTRPSGCIEYPSHLGYDSCCYYKLQIYDGQTAGKWWSQNIWEYEFLEFSASPSRVHSSHGRNIVEWRTIQGAPLY